MDLITKIRLEDAEKKASMERLKYYQGQTSSTTNLDRKRYFQEKTIIETINLQRIEDRIKALEIAFENSQIDY